MFIGTTEFALLLPLPAHTMKLKRRFIALKYSDIIESFYNED